MEVDVILGISLQIPELLNTDFIPNTSGSLQKFVELVV